MLSPPFFSFDLIIYQNLQKKSNRDYKIYDFFYSISRLTDRGGQIVQDEIKWGGEGGCRHAAIYAKSH